MTGSASCLVILLACVATSSCATASGREPGTLPSGAAATTLRVCADPNNLPFSNERREGFENRIVEMLAADLGRVVEYTWWASRRGFIRNTLNAGLCDVVMGVPVSVELALTTRPYYRSSYVFVSERSRRLRLRSLDDPRLQRLRIGVQMIGDDFANTPPAHALSARGLISNIVGYSVYGDYSRPNPPAEIVTAVSRGEVDAAIVWGPLAGYFAARSRVPLEVTPVSPEIDSPFLPFVFDISMAVRRGDEAWRDRLDGFIQQRSREIEDVLNEYDVPRIGGPMQQGGDRGKSPNSTGTQPRTAKRTSPEPTPGTRQVKAGAGRTGGQGKHAAQASRGLKTSSTRKAGPTKTPRGTTTRSGDR
jgi:mxaJ protein